MLAQHFVTWCETANAAERCSGVALLADAVVNRKFLAAEIRQAEAALLFALDDPSPRVRRTIADLVRHSERVSRQLVRTLAADIDEIAVGIVEHSPLLTGADLVELVRGGSNAIRVAAARRRDLDPRAALEIAATGDAQACGELAANAALLAPASVLCRLVGDWTDHPRIRDALLRRDDLPSDLRHVLLVSLGSALCASPFVLAATGPARAARLKDELAEQATASLIEVLEPADLSPFVEHLRASGLLNSAVLVRAVCCGRIDLFASSLARLAKVPEKRVRAIVAEAREPGFAALADSAGLPRALVPLLLSAVRVWKDVSGSDDLDPADVASMVMERVVRSYRRQYDETAFAEIGALLHRLAGDTQRFAARRRAENYLAA